MNISPPSMGDAGSQGPEPLPATPALDRVREAIGRDRNPEYADMLAAGRELRALKKYYWNKELEQRATQLNLIDRINRMFHFWRFWELQITQAIREEAELEEQIEAELRSKKEANRQVTLAVASKYRKVHKDLMCDIISLVNLWIILAGALRPR